MSDHIITFTDEEELAIVDSGTSAEDWINGLITRARESLLQSYQTRQTPIAQSQLFDAYQKVSIEDKTTIDAILTRAADIKAVLETEVAVKAE